LHHGVNIEQPEFELGVDTEVSATTANRPKQVRILILRCPQDAAVSHNHLRGNQVVDREAAQAGQPARAAAQSQPAYSGMPDDASRNSEPVSLSSGVKIG
jgi:hypothetical protein